MSRISFFGLLANRSPLDSLLKHYDLIAQGVKLIENAMACFIGNEDASECPEFATLSAQLDDVEEEADGMKRTIFNHMPRGLSLPVDRVFFVRYVQEQDAILDNGQDSLRWLAMRRLNMPVELKRRLVFYLDDAASSVKLLGPALKTTVDLLTGEMVDRDTAKGYYRTVREKHTKVSQQRNELLPMIYNNSMLEFKEVYQLVHFVQNLYSMSRLGESCASVLRAMIAK